MPSGVVLPRSAAGRSALPWAYWPFDDGTSPLRGFGSFTVPPMTVFGTGNIFQDAGRISPDAAAAANNYILEAGQPDPALGDMFRMDDCDCLVLRVLRSSNERPSVQNEIFCYGDTNGALGYYRLFELPTGFVAFQIIDQSGAATASIFSVKDDVFATNNINDGNEHQWLYAFNFAQDYAALYLDGSVSPYATVQLSPIVDLTKLPTRATNTQRGLQLFAQLNAGGVAIRNYGSGATDRTSQFRGLFVTKSRKGHNISHYFGRMSRELWEDRINPPRCMRQIRS